MFRPGADALAVRGLGAEPFVIGADLDAGAGHSAVLASRCGGGGAAGGRCRGGDRVTWRGGQEIWRGGPESGRP